MPDQQLSGYIKQQLRQGVPKEVIADNLIALGWQQSDINRAFFEAMGPDILALANPDAGDTTKNGKAIVGLVLGLIGFIACLVGGLKESVHHVR